MLQQTQVNTVIPYFERWMVKFPSISVLARASEKSVLAQWEGLGYYSRARNLHSAARLIDREYGGVLPSNFADLQKLPGVGRYTAAAIASMAFGEDVAAMDGNIKRVLSRLYIIFEPINSTKGHRLFSGLASKNLPAGRAGDFNQALMDLGAMICLPRNPDCGNCPLASMCEAAKNGLQYELPVKDRKPKKTGMIKVSAVILQGSKAMIFRRNSQGLLGGMWEFPSVEVDTESPREWTKKIRASYGLGVNPVSHFASINHAYSHIELTEHAFLCTLKKDAIMPPHLKWVQIDKLKTFPMGKVDRSIAKKLVVEYG